MAIRILLLTQHFPPEEGAHAHRWEWLTQALLDRGHQVDVIVPRWRNREPHVPGHAHLDVREVKALVSGLRLRQRLANETLTALQTLWAGVRGPRPDIVVATVPALTTLPIGYLVSRLRRRRLVLDLRDAWPHILDEVDEWDDDGIRTPPARGPMRRRVAALLARSLWWLEARASGTMVTSEALAADLRRRGRPNVVVVRNVPRPPAELKVPCDDHPELRVLYLGSVGRAQKLATAVKAAALVAQHDIDIRLRLVGSGAHEHALRTFVRRSGAPVEVVGRIPVAQTPAEYAWADSVLVMLRDWAGMDLTVPSKLYEAMQSGRHVTASLQGEAAEIVREAAAGDVVTPEDPQALADLWIALARDRRRLAVGDSGVQWLRRHNDRDAQGLSAAHLIERVAADKGA